MSWDVVLMNPAGLPPSFPGAPSDWRPTPLGRAAQVKSRISEVLPEVDWTEPSWGRFEGGEYAIEFNCEGSDTVDDLTLHVTGNGDPIPTIVSLCKHNGWVAFDTTTGELLDLERPSHAGWDGFRQARSGLEAPFAAQARQTAKTYLFLLVALLSAGALVAAGLLLPERPYVWVLMGLAGALALLFALAAQRSMQAK